MPDIINMTITTPPAVNQSITGFGIKGDKGDAGDPATNLVTSVAGKQGVVTLDKTDVGLSNVDNTSDADKPVSTAQQTALNGKQDADATLTALAAHNTNGILTQTAADTFTGRTITGTTNQVTVTNGDGVGGNPTLSLPQNIHTGASPEFAGIKVGGADAIRSFNVKGTGVNARLSIQGTLTTDQPGIEFTNDSNTNRALIRMDSVSTTGTSLSIFTEPVSGSVTERLIIDENGNTKPATDSTYTLGASSKYWKETYTNKLFLNSTATLDGSTAGEIKGTGIFTADNIKRGTGFPEGVVTANVGTVYIDTAVTNGASSWVKKSGTGNTGWQVLEGDTGWRQMKADWNVSPRSSGDGFVERLLIRRVGNRITLACYLTAAFGGGKNHSVAAFLPVGFRNTSSLGVWPEVNRFRLTSSQTTYVDPILETGTAGNLRIITPSPTHEAYSEIAWVTDHQWPATLPGVSA